MSMESQLSVIVRRQGIRDNGLGKLREVLTGMARNVSVRCMPKRRLLRSAASSETMPRSPSSYRRLAHDVLSERGLAAVWQLHLDAVAAHLAGFPGAAALQLSVADAGEELVWWRIQVTEVPQPDR